MKKKKKGFTLVELVIVIAVIAILAAVLIPTFSSVIKNANNSADLQLVNNLNIVASTHSVSGTDNEFETADNIRKMLAEEGINPDSLATKNKNVVIVYNTETKQFERWTLNDDKSDLVAFAEELDFHVGYYLEELFEKIEKVDENTIIRKNKIIVSTGGNKLAEAISALHNLPYKENNKDIADHINDQLNKIKDKTLLKKIQFIMEDAIFITDKNGDEEGSEKAVSVSFDADGNATVTENIEGKKRIIFHEHKQELNLDDSKFDNAKSTLYAIIPNYVTAVYGNAGGMYLSGNTSAFGINDISEANIETVENIRSFILMSDDDRSAVLSLADNPEFNLSDTEYARVEWTVFEGKLKDWIKTALKENKDVDLDNSAIDAMDFTLSMNDGKYYYGYSEVEEEDIKEGEVYDEKYINGGTYQLTVKYTEDGKEKEINGKDGNPLIVKLKTVQINSAIVHSDNKEVWFTIEEALALAGTTKDGVTYGTTVVVAGSTTTTYLGTGFTGDAIVTAFTALDDSVTGYSDAGRTIGENVTLVLPYDGENASAVTNFLNRDGGNTYRGGQSLGDDKYKKTELFVPDNMTITNNGTIDIGGVTDGGTPNGNDSINAALAGAGKTSGRYAQIKLGDGAIINSYGDINSYGFIVENNTGKQSAVNMLSGSALLMPLIIIEHRGGNATKLIVTGSLLSSSVNMKVLPFNRYYMQNITSMLKIEAGANLNGVADLYMLDYQTAPVNFIGGDGYFFQLQDGSYVTWKYDVATQVVDFNTFGNVKINPLKLDLHIQYTGFNKTLALSTEKILVPISWHYNITMNKLEDQDEATVTSSQAIKLLPGAVLKIQEGVKAELGKIIVYADNWDDSKTYPSTNTSYPTGKGDATLIVNGELTATDLAGYVGSEVKGAVLYVTKSTSISSSEVGSGSSLSVNTTSYSQTSLTGVIYSKDGEIIGNSQTLSAKVKYMTQDGQWVVNNS